MNPSSGCGFDGTRDAILNARSRLFYVQLLRQFSHDSRRYQNSCLLIFFSRVLLERFFPASIQHALLSDTPNPCLRIDDLALAKTRLGRHPITRRAISCPTVKSRRPAFFYHSTAAPATRIAEVGATAYPDAHIRPASTNISIKSTREPAWLQRFRFVKKTKPSRWRTGGHKARPQCNSRPRQPVSLTRWIPMLEIHS